jgi:16S rRNA (adenine1518-N6/adenine1519-N6)-dimethyltransferase
VRLNPKKVDAAVPANFAEIVSSAFAQKRKTILNNLKAYNKNAGELLKLSGVDPNRRAETLALDEWKTLSRIFADQSKVTEVP